MAENTSGSHEERGLGDGGMAVETADVVVVGGGGSGLAAAVAASARGVRTWLLERQGALGGSTALSVGSLCAAGTRFQRRRGIVDSPDAYVEDMAAFNPELAKREPAEPRAMLAVESAQTLQWLESLGVAFAGPYPEPPHRVPRLHMVIPGSRLYIACLGAAARRQRVTFALDAAAERLLLDDQRQVVGVEYSQNGERRQLRTTRGVVLATGDFSGNRPMRLQYLGPDVGAAQPINPNTTGDGQRMAAAIGARLYNMDFTFGPALLFPRSTRPGLVDRLPTWRWLSRLESEFVMRSPTALLAPYAKNLLITNMSPSLKLFHEGAVLVNLDGGRFCDERKTMAVEGRALAVALAQEREGRGYILFDGQIAGRFSRYPYFISTAPGIAFAYFRDYARGRPDLVHSANDVASLAAAIGADRTKLDLAVASAPRPLHPPFHALGPVGSVITAIEGSLAVDGQCRVLREDGNPIPGLFAAGYTGQGGMFLGGHGMHIAWAMTSGRVAGEGAARRPPGRGW